MSMSLGSKLLKFLQMSYLKDQERTKLKIIFLETKSGTNFVLVYFLYFISEELDLTCKS